MVRTPTLHGYTLHRTHSGLPFLADNLPQSGKIEVEIKRARLPAGFLFGK
jgi:hypothetical protein